MKCVRVAEVETTRTQRRPTLELAEEDAIGGLAAISAQRGGNYLRVECMTTLASGSRGYAVFGTGAAYRCATPLPASTRATSTLDTRSEGSRMVCEKDAGGLSTCHVQYGDAIDISNEVPNGTDYGSQVAPPADLPRVTCGVHEHQGFYLRATLGGGAATLAGSSVAETSLPHGTIPAMVALGGTPARGLVVGGGARAGLVLKHHADSRASTSAIAELGVLADWFPDAKGGAHVGLLAGVGALQNPGVPNLSSHLAPAGALFAGYDAWLASQTALGVMLVVAAAPGGADIQSGEETRAATPIAVSLEASFAYQ